MERVLFWIWKSLKAGRRSCRGFCPACAYYQICCRDGELRKVKVKVRR
ncbi:MAG: hypothetical protein K6E50_15200 [Lachnospiraceae bacterium]|nr:hypothetical protein [Lachnospiraceae bacterium]